MTAASEIADLRPPKRSDAAALGPVLYRAFARVAEEFSYRSNFPDTVSAEAEAARLLESRRYFGLVATIRGRVVGGAFAMHGAVVSGVGPIVVDPSHQGHGIGRQLMVGLMADIRTHGYTSARLQQDAPNVRSMTLYSTVGFDYVDTSVILEAQPRRVEAIRPATVDDAAGLHGLCRDIYGVDRHTEIDDALAAGLLIVAGTPATGYLIPSVFGHGVASRPEIAIALAQHAATVRGAPTRFMCFLRHADVYRAAIDSGCVPVKVMNLMAWGGYVVPGAYALPSISF